MSRPKKARTGWSQEEDDIDAEQQNTEFRYQKRDLDTKKETWATSIPQKKKTSRYQLKESPIFCNPARPWRESPRESPWPSAGSVLYHSHKWLPAGFFVFDNELKSLNSLLFFDFLAFFFFRFSLLFLAFLLPFPRILGVPRRVKPLLLWGRTLAFFWRIRIPFAQMITGRIFCFGQLPPGTKPIHAGKNSWGINPCPSFPWLFGFPWLIFYQGISLLEWGFSLFSRDFQAFGRDGKSLVNLEVFLGKTEQPRKGRTGIFFANTCGGLYSHSREYRKIFLRSHFLHISQILEGNYFGAYTCRACIRTRANTGKYSWGIIYVLVSCQGVIKIM